MAIVTQTDKRTGITYAYETQYYWDKEKQQSRAKRVCVGKVDPATKEIIPTRGRSKKREETTECLVSKRDPKSFCETKHLYYVNLTASLWRSLYFEELSSSRLYATTSEKCGTGTNRFARL